MILIGKCISSADFSFFLFVLLKLRADALIINIQFFLRAGELRIFAFGKLYAIH